MKSRLLDLYQERFGHRPDAIIDLRADGSNRSLYRLIRTDGSGVIGVWGPDPEENQAFVSFSRAFRKIGLPVPDIYAVDAAAGLYLEEDLGDTTLFAALIAARTGDDFPGRITAVYRSVVEMLPRVQVEGGAAVDYSVAYPCTEFDRRSMMWDLNYFKYHFVKLARIPFNEARLEQDFDRLCDVLLRADRTHFLYRDFQSRNIMLRDGDPWLIDYQGGRRGALQYDIASLLYDAKADIPDEVRDELLEHYLSALANYVAIDRTQFIELYRGYVLIRIMQAMGAYGYRGFFEGKSHFLASVPYAIDNIEGLLRKGLPVEMPELRGVLERIARSDLRDRVSGGPGAEPRSGAGAIPDEIAGADVPAGLNGHAYAAGAGSAGNAPGALVVTITSFSYRRGYPADVAGNGGGFVFDCRALHNPGRYDQYRDLCGRDAGVVEFLEREEAVEDFWSNVVGLVEASVRSYLERRFTNLAVSFGCTGGQHRSVYFAERLARHLREHHPDIRVALLHREEEKWSAPGVRP